MTTEVGDDLVAAADEARARLLDTVVRIDQRRRRAFEVPKQVAGFLRQFGLVVAAVAAAGVTALVVHGNSVREGHRRRDRWRLAQNVWRHPDRELRAERRPFAAEVMRSLLFTLVTSVLAIPVRRAVRAMSTGSSGEMRHPSEEGRERPS